MTKDTITLNQPIYYIPQYGSAANVSVLRVKDNGMAVVVRNSKKQDNKPFNMPLEFVFNDPKRASNSMRSWENYKKKEKKKKKGKNNANSEKQERTE